MTGESRTADNHLIAELKANEDPEFWNRIVEETDKRIRALLGDIDGPRYTEWGLLAVKALSGSEEARQALGAWPERGSQQKKILDELALLYLVQPVLRRQILRAEASARRPEQG